MTARLFSILPAIFAALTMVFAPVMIAHGGILPGGKITIRQENEMGRNFDQILRSQMAMVGDAYITDYVAEMVNRVVQGKRPMPFKIGRAHV